MIMLAVESSCDETAVAVVRDGRTVLADAIASQADMHAVYGGVVPEIASRKHVEAIAGLTDLALSRAEVTKGDIDAVAVTYAPGLIGAVLVGVNYAKALAFGLNLPLVPVHHVRGHIAANYITHPDLEPPFVCLCVSGGTTAIVDVRTYTEMEVLGATRDDAAGECFDKAARVLGIGYPGGGPMDRLARGGDDGRYELPRAHVDGAPLDMSFSGLKTAVLNLAHNAQQKGEKLDLPGLAASFGAAVSGILVPRTMEAARRKGYGKVAVAGGVAANSRLRADLERACRESGDILYLPELKLCGDNGAMIGCQGYYEYLAGKRAGMDLNAFANRDIGRG
ncbi:tRNA (adenosine(37)-N6)-threonylcarbamoyltransferase complex transferase subunit TsaD [Lawsonibacter faecis]|uniref:tRNA N6-adenosine threonylcarbamoyltransferase n=1 Tax=Lawsonibacter faecis TaxID=2763052 RepID=A0A8J6J417_9FIRM|nr:MULTISPECIES: tRNA (adenosine(37)-N6)-threonylcarbamoyltransferase complex transferase subunit TsaD [Oscillospiraceae]MTQ96508.1 tRNA (adenosine(37)-N6)-threonylcarbamoyltransferase complex transferase subunit TsaD [Pseudoflavonifractor sp. BIOML-A16]MTR05898.1 tRNA (adenosine(37)-N6)-threonylcarbamoyltransferase complex transferase subunit TsaD [Pseudoflavonifractor sp. BIOML-A15]MTR72511.1 tRNA (adenosine(37)-N6)-threonylcarbamoyltransferase complex transferase subunit TsaD [Pseudoflavonifr